MPFRRVSKVYVKKKRAAATKIQRAFRRKRATAGLAMAKKLNHKGLYFHREKKVSEIRFNNTDPDSGAYINTTTGDAFYCLNWNAGDIANYMSLSGVFKRYQLTGIKVEIFPNNVRGAQAQLITGWSGTQGNANPPAPNTINVNNVNHQPNMYNKSKLVHWKNRYVDSTNWTDVAQAMEGDAKSQNFNRPWKHYMIPRVQEKSEYIKFDGTGDTMDFTRAKKAWLDTAQGDILHKGVRLCFEGLVPTNYDFTDSPPPTLRMLTTYYITFQGQQ